ncbi:hypothetical protein [Pseudomonas schmalbachii]|uniref:Uncharacterized protein n=1 Tax=Pseudomonas schmalbachii TaxID=2816993 RepID=A0ABS3TQ38_9PSED|nr:hypothetical protein [Pseudomonas schmalbachii]MBO3275763.1 hypothetical protein [Pseudomonas schmalbachii]
MKNEKSKIEKARKIVIKQLNYIKKEVQEWLEHPRNRSSFLDGSIENLRNYISTADDIQLLGLGAANTAYWYLNEYSNSIFFHPETGSQKLALLARHNYASVMFDAVLIEQQKLTSGLLLTEAAFNLSTTIIAGWNREFHALVRALHAGLDTELLDLHLTHLHENGTLYRHFWFLLHLVFDVEKLSIDTSLYSYPESLTPYDEVLSDWKTTDLEKVGEMVQCMADFHVQHSREDSQGREVYEFEEEDYWLFPYEIFAFLRLREWIGLKNPQEFDHPLMQQPLGRLPCEPGVPLARPDTPLLDQVVAKFNQQYPNSIPWPKD